MLVERGGGARDGPLVEEFGAGEGGDLGEDTSRGVHQCLVRLRRCIVERW